MGINRIRLQNGATGDPRVDARMQQTYQENIRRNNAERTINQMSRDYDFSGLSSLGLNPKTYDSTPGPMRGLPAVGDSRERLIRDIMNRNQPYSLTPPKPPEPTDPLTGMPEAMMLPNMADGSMRSLAQEDAIRNKVLAAQQAQEKQYYLTDPISGKQYKSEQEAINDLGIVTYNQRFASGGRVGFQDGTDPNLTARQVAEQNPELNTIREQLFGENYLDDIEQGTGIAQYYTGFGQMPTLDYTPPVVEEAAPAVDVTQPIVDTGGDGGGGGIDISTGNETGNTAEQQRLLDAGIGVQAEPGAPISAPGEGMLTQQAIDELADYPLNTSYGVGGADGMSGGQATPGAEFADQNPYGGTGTMDDLGADSFPEYQEPTVANLASTAPGITDYLEGIDPATGLTETIDTRATEPPSLGFGNAPEADIYQDPIMGMANMNQADVIASDANVGFDTPEQTNAINEAFNSVKDLGAAGVDKLRDSLVALGGKVKEGFDNTVEIGGKTIDLGKSLLGGAISLATGIPGVGFLLNAIQSDPVDAATKTGLQEKGYGFDDIGRLTDGPMAGYAVESAFGDGIADATLDRIDKIENRDAPQTEDSIEKVQELYDFLGDITEVKAEEFGPQEDVGAIPGDINTGVAPDGTLPDGTNIMDEFKDNDIQPTDPTLDILDRGRGNNTGPTSTDPADDFDDGTMTGGVAPTTSPNPIDSFFDAVDNAASGDGPGTTSGGLSQAQSTANIDAARGGNTGSTSGSLSQAQSTANIDAARGGGSSGGGGKIVCTMMNNSYGFGSFRNKIWLKHSKDLAPEYQIGYHKIFLPLVKLSKTNKVLKKTLEHIAIHRTIDIRQEARGKVHLLGRVYRKILEPICYLVGKYVK